MMNNSIPTPNSLLAKSALKKEEPEQIADVPAKPKIIRNQHFSHQHINGEWLNDYLFFDCVFENVSVHGGEFKQLHFEDCHFNNVTIQGIKAETVRFIRCQQASVSIAESEIFNLSWHENECHDIDFRQCLLEGFIINHCSARNMILLDSRVSFFSANQLSGQALSFSQSAIQDTNWADCQLEDCQWQQVTLLRHVMGMCSLKQCLFAHLEGHGRTWYACQLTDCQLSHLSLQGSSFHQSQIQDSTFECSDLSWAIFTEAQVTRTRYNQAQMPLIQAQDAKFSECDMRSSVWTKSTLPRAIFHHCQLEGAVFAKADLRAVNFTGQGLLPEQVKSANLHNTQNALGIPLSSTPDPFLLALDGWYERYKPGVRQDDMPKKTGASQYV